MCNETKGGKVEDSSAVLTYSGSRSKEATTKSASSLVRIRIVSSAAHLGTKMQENAELACTIGLKLASVDLKVPETALGSRLLFKIRH
jgi:hypothetical protein